MNGDEPTVAEEKVAIAQRIRGAITQIKRQVVDRSQLAVLDRFLTLVQPGNAYCAEGPETRLSFVPDMHRNHTHRENRWCVLWHDLGLLLLAYWVFIRSDETLFLVSRLQRIEDYAKYGLDQCVLLGSMEDGFYLHNMATQQVVDEAHADAIEEAKSRAANITLPPTPARRQKTPKKRT